MQMKMTIDMPESVTIVLNALHEKGFEAYAVGGCVRDTILGREPDDWDITTSALPKQVKEIFHRTVDTGLQHGTVTVLIGNYAHEVTTYRVDGEYEDGRHPKQVAFTPDLAEDLKRRDFTINAMAYNKEEGLVDLFGGIEDIEEKRIRCVGNAWERFGEDALRIMRALRFSAQLGFSIEAKTLQAVTELSPTLARISAERINVELTKTLKSRRPEYLMKCYEAGITAIVMPELDRCMKLAENKEPIGDPERSLGAHMIRSTTFVSSDPILRWTMLLHEISGEEEAERSAEEAKKILKRLKFDNETIRQAVTLIRYHKDSREAGEYPMRKLLSELGPELTFRLFEVQRADWLAASSGTEEEPALISEKEALCRKILERGDCYQMKMLAVTGQDLIRAGMKPGKEIGRCLADLLELVLENPEMNRKEVLLAHIQKA